VVGREAEKGGGAYASMKRRMDLDVSGLPGFAFGSRAVTWWAVVGFLAIEGTMLALCFVTYFYLSDHATDWPPPPTELPDIFIPTINLFVILASAIPMYLVDRAAKRLSVQGVIIGLVVCDIIGIAFCILRGFEFTALNVYWDTNAYGSIVWTIMVIHTFHLVSEVVETIVITVLFALGHTEPRYMVDATDNALYWYFIVGIWIPCYVLLFLAPRFL
jgi:cytochrome c oxidase subunit 1/cytochrome c oxidase subunit I+III